MTEDGRRGSGARLPVFGPANRTELPRLAGIVPRRTFSGRFAQVRAIARRSLISRDAVTPASWLSCAAACSNVHN